MPGTKSFNPFIPLENILMNVENIRNEFFPPFDPDRYEDFFVEYNETKGYKIFQDPERKNKNEIVYFEDHLRALFNESIKEVEDSIITLRMSAGKNNWSDYSDVLKKKLKLISGQYSKELSLHFRHAPILFDNILRLIDYYNEDNFTEQDLKSNVKVHTPKSPNKRKLTTLLDEPLNDETLRYLYSLRLGSYYLIDRTTKFEIFKEVINSKNLEVQKANKRSIKLGCPTKHAVLILDVLKPLIPRILQYKIIEPFGIFITTDNTILASGNGSSSLSKAKKLGTKLTEDISSILQTALQYQKGK